MSRRGGTIHRGGGGGGGGPGGGSGGGTNSPASLLGNTLLLDWYSTQGASGSGTAGAAWVDQVRGATFAGTGSPVLAAVPTKGNGIPAWNFIATSAQFFDTGALATLIAAGAASFYVSAVFRQPTVLTNVAEQRLVELYNSAGSTEFAHHRRDSVANGGTWKYLVPSSTLDVTYADDNTNVAEYWLNANGTAQGSIGGGDGAPTGAAQTAATNLQRLLVGANVAGALPGDLQLWRLRVLSAAPSRGIREQLLRQDAAAYGAVLFF